MGGGSGRHERRSRRDSSFRIIFSLIGRFRGTKKTKESQRTTSFVLFNFTSRTKTDDKRRTTEIEAKRCSGGSLRDVEGNKVSRYKKPRREPRGNDRSSLWSRRKRKKNGLFVAIRGSILAANAATIFLENWTERRANEKNQRIKESNVSYRRLLLRLTIARICLGRWKIRSFTRLNPITTKHDDLCLLIRELRKSMINQGKRTSTFFVSSTSRGAKFKQRRMRAAAFSYLRGIYVIIRKRSARRDAFLRKREREKLVLFFIFYRLPNIHDHHQGAIKMWSKLSPPACLWPSDRFAL